MGAGTVWVFKRSGSEWAQQGPALTAGAQSAGTDFGQSVALSGNGEIALVGGPSTGDGVGGVWVFRRSGREWTQQGSVLEGSGEAGQSAFGSSLAISANGTVVLIGEPFASGGGAAWVFKRSGSTWTQQHQTLTGAQEGEVSDGDFGSSVALSADGKVALIGGPAPPVAKKVPRKNVTPRMAVSARVETVGLKRTGAAWVFEHVDNAWKPVGEKLSSPSEGPEAQFGSSVALSSDGNLALVGAVHAGTVQVYARTAQRKPSARARR
jgi:hypothetical protein